MQALLMLLITLCITSCWILRNYMSKGDIVVTLFFNVVIPFSTTGIFILLASGLYGNQQLQIILHQISEFDRRLSQVLQITLHYKTPCKKIVLVRLLFWTTLVVIDAMTALALQNLGPLSVSEYVPSFLLYFMVASGSSLYDCFIMECQKRVKFTNGYIEEMLFRSCFVRSIEMKLTPVVNVCYRLEDIKTELSMLIDVVENTNKYFVIQLCIKVVNLFIGFLWSAYYFLLNSGITFDVIHSVQFELYAVVWLLVCTADFCIDVRIYQRLLGEVRK